MLVPASNELQIVPGKGFHECCGLAQDMRWERTPDNQVLFSITGVSGQLEALTAVKVLGFDPAVLDMEDLLKSVEP
jgi:hypothetical protein